MTNTTDFLVITDRSAFLDALDHHTAFAPFINTSGEEGFEFHLLVTAREFWIVMGVLHPIIEAGEAELQLSVDMAPAWDYRRVSVDVRGAQVVEVGHALIRAYDRINAAG